MASLSLNPVVDVVVQVSPLSAPRRAFDTSLIIGPSTVIAPERLRLYEGTDAMLEDGFARTSPEYLAAQLYFSQSPRPRKIMVGRLMAKSILTMALADAGTGYKIGDVLAITGGGGSGGSVKVTGTDSKTGAVTTIAFLTGGTGYATAATAATTGGAGTGCTINIQTVGTESFVSAVAACRAANMEWYAVSCLDATKADILAVAAYIETALPTSTQFYTTRDADVPDNVAGNIFATLKGLQYSRSMGLYSTSSPYAAVSIMGYAMRANTGLANSAYTLKFKKMPGVATEGLSPTQVGNIEGNNGNLYVNRGHYYDMYEQGVMANGQFFDEIINLDMLSNNIQLNVMDMLYKLPKVAQTESGITQLIAACNSACEKSVRQGFLAPGKWTGQQVLALSPGDTLPLGYLVQSEAIKDQDQADREARKSPPIYVSIKEAGAVHSVTIGVYVSR